MARNHNDHFIAFVLLFGAVGFGVYAGAYGLALLCVALAVYLLRP